jgi:ribonuclease HII
MWLVYHCGFSREFPFFHATIKSVQWLVGIDEAGRGALAGPVSVGAVLYPGDFNWREAFALVTKRGEPKLRDSKQLSPQQRGILYEYIATHGRLRHAHAFVSAESIDTIGIVNAAHEAAAIAVGQLGISPERVKVLLDAGLRVPTKWEQESFVRGDENIPAIAFASIIAKVTRDRHMEDLSESHARYGFELHKGYGTHAHRLAIRKHGVLPLIHRKTFLTAFA